MLPYYFEIILGNTATQAGYNILPYLLLTILFSLLTGMFTTRVGWFWHWLILGPMFTVVSGAVYYKLTEFAPSATCMLLSVFLNHWF